MTSFQQEPLHVKRVTTLAEFESLREEWNSLLQDSASNSFFLRWEWLFEWWKVYNENLSLSIILVFRGPSLIGIGPFYVKNEPHGDISSSRRLMFLGTKEDFLVSEYMDIIYRERDCDDVLRNIIECVLKNDLCTDIFLQKIEETSCTLKSLKKLAGDYRFFYDVVKKETSPCIKLPSSFDEFLGVCGSSIRYKIRNNQRRLSMSPQRNALHRTADPRELDGDIDELVRLHQLRWEKRDMPGAFSDKKFLGFQRQVMREMLKNGHLELSFLSIEGRNIAALYNISYNGKIYFYQSGLDASFRKDLSPGLLLHSFSIMDAIKSGLREYDFLLNGKTDDYKKSWTKECRRMCDVYMVRPGITKLAMMARAKIKGLYASMNNRCR